MIPLLLRFAVGIAIIGALLYVGAILLPAIVAAVGMVIAIKKRHPSTSGRACVSRLRRLDGGTWFAAGVFAALAAAVGFGAAIAVAALLDVARGLAMARHAGVFLVAAAVAGAGVWFFFEILKGRYMKDIFLIVDDKARFDAFLENDQPAAAVEIDPEALARALRADVIGQDAIVQEVSETLGRRARLRRPGKPLGVFMFVGATGAGKTELAKALAKHAFEGRLARFDCNELTESHSTQRLIGAPPGYVGSDQGGQLTREIQRLRSGVLLFDEIEKAHSDVYKLLMGLLDEGRVTEQSTGKTMDASSFTIVLTSNAEHDKLARLALTITDPDDRRRAVKDTLLTTFKPEQLARIDEVFCFKPLDRRALAQVVGKFLFSFASDAGVELAQVDAGLLIDTIARFEKQSDYGIRQLVRLVEKAVLDGMLEARAAGFKRVAIVCESSRIEVRGVAESEVQA